MVYKAQYALEPANLIVEEVVFIHHSSETSCKLWRHILYTHSKRRLFVHHIECTFPFFFFMNDENKIIIMKIYLFTFTLKSYTDFNSQVYARDLVGCWGTASWGMLYSFWAVIIVKDWLRNIGNCLWHTEHLFLKSIPTSLVTQVCCQLYVKHWLIPHWLSNIYIWISSSFILVHTLHLLHSVQNFNFKYNLESNKKAKELVFFLFILKTRCLIIFHFWKHIRYIYVRIISAIKKQNKLFKIRHVQ